MSTTEGPNTASTGSMRTAEARVHAVPAMSNAEILGVHAVFEVQNLDILRILAVYIPEMPARQVLGILQSPVPSVVCSNSHWRDHL